MPLTLSLRDAALRLVLSMVAGALLGLNRSERGHVAGLRTTMLVCVAAAVSMLQVNLLLVTAGKTGASFSVLDLMRLPLGVLTGMGFIGAGVIVKRGEAVNGVTTAAVLWLATIVGLCLGGGQLVLGCGVTLAALALLPTFGWFERTMAKEHRGTLTVETSAPTPTEATVKALLVEHGYAIERWSVSYAEAATCVAMSGEVKWRCRGKPSAAPPFLGALASQPGVVRAGWTT
jgi:putative Mg2+ transporter-C (MgtC) family protein